MGEKLRGIRVFALSFAVASLFAASAAWAQSASTSALSGTVTDPTRAVIPNVTVTVTSAATNQVRNAITGADGSYRFPLLEPGAYRVKFAAAGFKTAEVTAVTLVVTETAVLDRALEVGSQSEQVTVEANVETVQTATSTLGTTVTGNTITALPLSTRNFTQVLGMSTGVAVEVSNGAAFGRGSQNMSVNGANPEKNNFQMDGVSINNAAGNNQAGDSGLYTGIGIPNPDAIQEFKVQTSTYDASFGRNPGANVNVVTKSGTNSLHGSLFEFLRNEALNANDFFYNRDGCPRYVNAGQSCPKQALKQNQFGGTIGGPIKKDKLFFFGSYQGTRQRNGIAPQGFTSALLYPLGAEGLNRGTTSLAGVDDAAAASFRKTVTTNMCGLPLTSAGVSQAGTKGSLCGAGAIPINDVAMRLMQVKLPGGNYYIPTSGTSGTSQRLYSIPGQYSEDQYIANVDWLLTQKNTMQAKFMSSSNPFNYQLSGNFGQLPGRQQKDLRSNTTAVLRMTSIVSNTIVNQARGSFLRIMQDGSDVLPYTPQQVGIRPLTSIASSNTPCPICKNTGGDFTQPPVMSIGGAFAIGGGLNPAFSPTTQIGFADEISWSKGRHTIRVGFEYEDVRWPLTFGGPGRGNLIMGSFGDFLIGRAGCAPTGPCSTSTLDPNGFPTNGTRTSSIGNCLFCQRSSVNGNIHGYQLKNMNTFFQDDWKVSARLTLNMGVRWEYDGSLMDRFGNLTNFWASDLAATPATAIPSALDTNNAILTLQGNPNAFRGYVVASNYNTASINAGGHGPIPAGVRVFDGNRPSQNDVPLSNFAPRIGFAWQPIDNGRMVIRGGVGLFYDRVGINRLVHAVQEGRPYADTLGTQNDISSLQRPFQERPLTLLPRWFNPTTLIGSSFNSPYYDRLHTPLVRQYNLGLQYEFISGYVMELAFVGSSGINVLDYSHNVNTARIVSPANPITLSGGTLITTNTAANASARVPYLGFLPFGLQQNGFDGVNNYNSLQTTVRKNFARGLGFQASYTWSKNLSNVGFDAANLNLSTDMAQQYGATPYSRPHRFVLSYQYELPYKSTGFSGKILGGWSISGLTTMQSGSPLTLFDNRGGSFWGTPGSGTVENGLSRAQLAPGFTYGQIATPGGIEDRLGGISGGPGFFNKSAFAAPPVHPLASPEPGTTVATATDYGNSGVGIVRGPHQLNFDFSIQKVMKFGERQSLQFRTEFFNIFNHAQFALPGYTAAPNNFANNGPLFVNGSFGTITSTSVNPRLMQFGLRYAF